MNLKLPVSHIMSKDFGVVSADACIAKAEKIMRKKGLRLLAVQEDDQLLGIVSHKDCKNFREMLAKEGIAGPDEALQLKHHRVHEIMNTKLIRLSTNDTIKMAIEIMKSIIFQVIPVVEQKKMVGVLTPIVIRKCADRENLIIS